MIIFKDFPRLENEIAKNQGLLRFSRIRANPDNTKTRNNEFHFRPNQEYIIVWNFDNYFQFTS
jgi:hypothetical protein